MPLKADIPLKLTGSRVSVGVVLNYTRRERENMKAYLILENGMIFTGESIGSKKEIISELVFNTSMTGYLEVLTDPSYAGQAV